MKTNKKTHRGMRQVFWKTMDSQKTLQTKPKISHTESIKINQRWSCQSEQEMLVIINKRCTSPLHFKIHPTAKNVDK